MLKIAFFLLKHFLIFGFVKENCVYDRGWKSSQPSTIALLRFNLRDVTTFWRLFLIMRASQLCFQFLMAENLKSVIKTYRRRVSK